MLDRQIQRAALAAVSGGCTVGLARVCFLIACIAIGEASAQNARVTQLDTSAFPHITVYVSLTDESGNPISVSEPVKLKIFEDKNLVKEEVLSEGGGEGYSVLVLDLSHSMKGDKLAQARAAAINYVNLLPPGFQISVVGFADSPSEICKFTNDRKRLRGCIESLQNTLGKTALQAGIGKGLDLLKGKPGRKTVVALTDGYENSSGAPYKGSSGLEYLLSRGASEEATVSVVGLGAEINEPDLKKYERTGGTYLNSPTPAQLAAAFGKVAKLIESERKVEYETAAARADGTRGRIWAQLFIGKNDPKPSVPRTFVRPGLLPHVRGEHFWFIIIIAVLFFLPKVFLLLRSFYAVWRFRTRHVRRLEPSSAYLSRRDPNFDPSQDTFQVGDLIVVCPASNTPYYVRSWRMYKCQCGRDGHLCSGHFCYHRVLPSWARSALNMVFKNREGKAGRTWLCHCAGDKYGY